MKNIQTLKAEIKRVQGLNPDDFKPAAYRRERKIIPLCSLLVKYLETNPDELFVKGEIKKLEGIISAKMLEFKPEHYEKLAKKEVAKIKKEHESKYGISKLRTQVRTLRYLLS